MKNSKKKKKKISHPNYFLFCFLVFDSPSDLFHTILLYCCLFKSIYYFFYKHACAPSGLWYATRNKREKVAILTMLLFIYHFLMHLFIFSFSSLQGSSCGSTLKTQWPCHASMCLPLPWCPLGNCNFFHFVHEGENQNFERITVTMVWRVLILFNYYFFPWMLI